MTTIHKISSDAALIKNGTIKLNGEGELSELIYNIGLLLPLEAIANTSEFVVVDVISSNNQGRTIWPLESPIGICFARYNDLPIIARETHQKADFISKPLLTKSLLKSLFSLPLVKQRNKTIITLYKFLLAAIGEDQLKIIFEEAFSIALIERISAAPGSTLRRQLKEESSGNPALLKALEPFSELLEQACQLGTTEEKNSSIADERASDTLSKTSAEEGGEHE
ncbi:hypothetical protein OAG1_17680 [Agarivorans sp. OAG1]|uniref:hypothetical protein n=1 Tax=Agarivorans sp. OAG1 TaxID=3082387 RepID=UPI002B307425|nr:hypothetical protein OAG1_17680 [Agarivorans sp. OAG1]